MTIATSSLVFQLSGTCNNYPWGKKGTQSLAARLCANTLGDKFEIDDDQFYSEMWFGDYPKFPARVLETGELLKDVLDRNKEKLLGKKVIENLDGQLPFLPKILSINKALPLQLHPKKELATKLHAENPEDFSDPNHKPEIAVALTKFELFSGFKPLPELESLFTLPPLTQFLPASTTTWTPTTLRETTRTILKSPPATIHQALTALSHLPASAFPKSAAHIPSLLPRLAAQHGLSDPAVLVALACTNFLVLGPGDAVFVPAGGVHAYLSGDIVECMARSDNVLNAGLCAAEERHDADVFADAMVTGYGEVAEDVRLWSGDSARSRSGMTVVYSPPMGEFDMLRAELGVGDGDEIVASEGPGVLIVTKGSGIMKADGRQFDLSEGFIFFVAPGVKLVWETVNGMEIHMAYV